IDVQTNGAVVIGGGFTFFGSVSRNHFMRLTSAGTLDPSMNVGTAADSFVDAVMVQADAKIVLGGSFTNYNEQTANYLTRVNGGINLGEGIIGFSSATSSISEDGLNLTVNVLRTAGTSNQVSVAYNTFDITATNGTHYGVSVGTNVFAAGETLKTFTVPIIDDGFATNVNRTFGIRLSNLVSSNGTATLGISTNIVTIVDNDAVLNFSAPTYVVSEIGGSALITVNRLGGSANACRVGYATSNNTALAGVSYTAVNGTLNWADGDVAAKTFSVPVIHNLATNGTLLVTLSLFNATNTTLATNTPLSGQTNALLSIVDQEFGPGQIGFLSANYSVMENSNAATITVIRTNGATGSMRVNYATVAGGTAVSGTHYTTASGTFTWADGDNTSRTFTVPVQDDQATNVNRTVNLRLSALQGGAAAGIMSATLTIVDDESLVGFSANAYNVTENAGSGTVTILRSGATAFPVTVTFTTADGTATAPADYTNATTTVTFGVGQVSTNLSVGIVDNGVTNANKTILLSLSATVAGTNAVVLNNALQPINAVLTIVDNDMTVAFSNSTYTVTENGGSALITVVRSGVTSGSATVNFTTSDGTALSYLDYTPTNGTLAFGIGVTSNSFTVPIIDNTATNGNKTVLLTLSNAVTAGPNSITLGTASATLTITDDDVGVGAGTNDVAFAPGLNGTVYAVKQYPAGGTVSSGSSASAVLTNSIWTAQGPAPASLAGNVDGITGNPAAGAVNRILPHPTNPNVVYVGTVNGGVWKTTNAASASPTWVPLTDRLQSLSVGALAFDSQDATFNTIIAGVADLSSEALEGGPRSGLQLTTDGGTTWSEINSIAGKNIVAVAKRGNTIVVAADTADTVAAANVGLFRSVNNGASFTQISSGAGPVPFGRAADLVVDPGSATTLYAAVWGAPSFGSGVSGVFKSTDFGATWSRVSDVAVEAAITVNTDNMKLAAGPGSSVYVGIVTNGQLAAVFNSQNGGTAWTAMDLPTTTESLPGGGTAQIGIHPGGQGSIHFALCADKVSPSLVYIAGDRQPGFGEVNLPTSLGSFSYSGRLFRGDTTQPTGSQWSSLTHSGTTNNSAPHPDNRGFAFDANGNRLFSPRIPKAPSSSSSSSSSSASTTTPKGNSITVGEYMYRDAVDREERHKMRAVAAKAEAELGSRSFRNNK
ncbi:MAG: hypothetical protein EBY09_11130, partial [Verrucomicrobia bacterium]|nr:hypothetical protein [Verrucomicrobiota bacterium]